jgi:hypothetical protein
VLTEKEAVILHMFVREGFQRLARNYLYSISPQFITCGNCFVDQDIRICFAYREMMPI